MSYYIELQNHFWDKDALYHFRPNEVAIWAQLLRMANAFRWELLTIELKDEQLVLQFSIAKEAVKAARARLAEAGLIIVTPGNGRGKATSYTIIIPEKVQRKRTLSTLKGGDKGAVKSDPLPDPPGEKGGIKGQSDPTLSGAEAAPGADPGAPKIKILEDTNVSSDPISAQSGRSEAGVEGNEAADIERSGTLYQACIDTYYRWYQRTTASPAEPEGYVPEINATQGASMKAIIKHLATQVTYKAESRQEQLDEQEKDIRVLRTWNHVLNHTHLLREWLQGQTRLQDFRSQIQNILKTVRDELYKQWQQKQRELEQQQPAGQSTPKPAPAQGRAAAGNNRRGGSIGGLQGLKRGGGPGPDQ